MICKPWDVVVVPFPFTESPNVKRRPALVLSTVSFNEGGHTVLAMITTKTHRPWRGDIDITDLNTTGLKISCIVRLKIFTLDNMLVIKKIGHLSTDDSQRVSHQLRLYVSLN